MLVRLRSPSGMLRVQCEPQDDLSLLVDKVIESAGADLDPTSITFSTQPKRGEHHVHGHHGTLKDFGLSHGDLIFVAWSALPSSAPAPVDPSQQEQQPAETSATAASVTNQETASSKDAWRHVQEDQVDVYWERQDGKIPRPKDPKFCRHGDKAMCDYCMPLEPYDDSYQQQQGIKHLSFHAYLRRLDRGTNKPTAGHNVSYLPPLEEPDFKVAMPCPSGAHAQWPGGICSKCQPSAITLGLQQYRLVDHVEFSDPTLIDRFINFWRRTGGQQRFGYLLGRYEAYDQVPMGIKAVVEAIHEPPQAGDTDGVEVNMEWDGLPAVEQLAAFAGLRVVGMVYSDLLNDPDSQLGGVICKRHVDSYFLSGLETIFSATVQHHRPNTSRFCMSGKYSSKFVTCVVTGNPEGEIEVQAYQASDQAMALVEADLVEPTVRPGLVRVKNDSEPPEPGSVLGVKRYVPDVFYSFKNEYNLQVKKSAKPCFPVDYLVVSLTHGFPAQPNPLFVSKKFPIENRAGMEDQSQQAVLSKIRELKAKLPEDPAAVLASREKGKAKESDVEALLDVARWASDWHLLAYLHTEMVGSLLEQADLMAFGQAAITANRDEEEALKAVVHLLQTSGWQTLSVFAAESAPEPAQAMDNDGFEEIPPELLQPDAGGGPSADEGGAGGGAGADSGSGVIVCPHCTFENPPGSTDCDICSLPLRS